MLKLIGIILFILFIIAISLVSYAIMGIKFLEEVNQAREDAKRKRDML